jgi:arylsulfatase A-like enzyme
VSADSRPNILLITLDQWRGDCLSALGHPCLKTPHLDALAQEGALFARHYTQASPCGPARASLLTGLYLHNHRSVRNGVPLDRRHTNLALEVRKAGYEPVLFGYTDTSPDPRGRPADDPALQNYDGILPGFAVGVNLPEDAWAWLASLKDEGYAIPGKPRDIWLPQDAGTRSRPTAAPPLYAARHSETAFITDAALRHLGAPGREPWFLHLSYFRPHPPFVAPEPYNTLYHPDEVPAPKRAKTRTEEAAQHPWLAAQLDHLYRGPMPVQDKLALASLDDAGLRQLRATYFGLIAELDDAIGRLVASLKSEGRWERTLVIVTADHGEQLGDHFLWGKDGYFEETFRVPLIIRDPAEQANATRGQQIGLFTEAIDVMPTLLDRLGLEIPPQLDGRSLAPLLAGRTPADWRQEAHWEYDFRDLHTPAVQSALGLDPEECLLTVSRGERWKYVHFAALPALLFDLERDPGELDNRAQDPACREALLEAAQGLLSWRMRHEDRTLSHLLLGPGGPRSRRGR